MKVFGVCNFLGLVTSVIGVVLVWVSIGFNIMDLVIFLEWEMFSGYTFSFIFLMLVDWVSLSFSGLVMLISGMVMIYSGEYMGHDKNLYRFFLVLVLFVVSMILMIYSPNIISILLGWDGLGLVSYCLVIYYQNMKSLNAGLLTILSNRIGDIAILLSIAWLFNYGSWNIMMVEYMYSSEILLILGLVMLASLTKSAQIPFSAWLPAAMAAPTPISALVHSSTLVTAGVYLMIRFSELLGINSILYYLSVLTMFMSGLGANYEMDLKKVIALSTLSQLGVMMMALSLGFLELAYFHLLMHALFKSLLFLCAGVYIHGFGDKQDIRALGGATEGAPLTSFFFLGCSLALCGFPFMSGFYSSDLILEMWMMGDLNVLKIVMTFLATIFTVTYSLRLFMYIVTKSGNRGAVLNSIEMWMTSGPMSVLFIFAVVSGAMMGWFFMPSFLISIPGVVKLMILVFILLYTSYWVAAGSMNLNTKVFGKTFLGMLVMGFFSSLWWLGNLATKWLYILGVGGSFMKMLDQGWSESFGPQGMFNKISSAAMVGDVISFMGFSKLMFGYLFLILVVWLVWN